MIKKILAQTLRILADQLDANTCNISEEDSLEIINTLVKCNSTRPMSKEQACQYLHLSRSTFDTYIRNGYIPKGQKILGFKELGWTKVDLDVANEKLKQLQNTQL